MDRARLGNTLGALATALADDVHAATERVTEHGASVPAALTTLLLEPGASIEQLRRALGITHSGGVRLVDRLVADGLAERRPGAGRRLTLVLTPAGRRAARRALGARRAAVDAALGALGDDELARLEGMVDKMLGALVGGEDDGWRICRLCDGQACPEPDCPVEQRLLAS